MTDTTTGETTTALSAEQPPSGGAADRGKEAAGTAVDRGGEVAGAAADQARSVAHTANEQAMAVGEQALGQARTVLDGATTEVRDQLEQRLRDLSASARTTAQELEALVDGRPEDAGRARDLAQQASGHIGRLADRADDLGVAGVVEEVSDLARRRPVLFLAGAATAGLLVGRLARAGREASSSSDDGPRGPEVGSGPPAPVLPTPAGAPTLPPPEPAPMPPPAAPGTDPGGSASGWAGA